MQERRKHKRLPVIRDLAQPIELTIIENHAVKRLIGVVTNLSAGGMDLVVMEKVEQLPQFRLNMHLPGFNSFEVEGRMVWARAKGSTTLMGIQFTKIDKDHARQISHMADAYWECENRIRSQAPIVCFHGCTFWDLCEKPAKLKNIPKPTMV